IFPCTLVLIANSTQKSHTAHPDRKKERIENGIYTSNKARTTVEQSPHHPAPPPCRLVRSRHSQSASSSRLPRQQLHATICLVLPLQWMDSLILHHKSLSAGSGDPSHGASPSALRQRAPVRSSRNAPVRSSRPR
ncbi:unnamed protein product, partial [Ectocarpus fasciculatus]